MWKSVLAAAILGDLLLAPILVCAASAFALEAGTKWLGVDGRWSTFDFTIGTAGAQQVSVFVSTGLSEIWVVQPGGCYGQNPLCSAARGGLYDFRSSPSWNPLGTWQLGLDALGGGGNGDYGLEALLVTNHYSSRTITIGSALVAAYNITNFYTGFLGVGARQSGFDKKSVNPLISQLAESYGEIPSHSYGFTAGAHYVGGEGGTPASLTLGGYDALRFKPHDISFHMQPSVQLPQALVRGIIGTSGSDNKPTTWNSTSLGLSSMNESYLAMIDTSTPYIWLPTSVCDRVASAFGLLWNETFGLYTFSSDDQYNQFLNGKGPSLTFALSSFDNVDDFGHPFTAHGVVNITLSSSAFAHVLQYGFHPSIPYLGKGVPYFPMKRATANNQVTLGRVFMQEAYLITKYEENSFSVHQALFPEDPRSNYQLVDIAPSPNSPFPRYTGPTGSGLSTGATAGIVVAAFITGSVAGLMFWCCLRKRRRTKEKSQQGDEEEQESVSDATQDPPPSPMQRIFSFIIRRKKSRRQPASVSEVHGDSAQPVEVGADATHEVYELPVPLEPAELDSPVDTGDGDDVTELGTEGSRNLSAYEIARRKLQRQLQGPVPVYSPPEAGSPHAVNENEKSEQDVSPVAHYRPGEDASPVSATPSFGNNSLPNNLPSPMTPHGEWTNRFDLPSPMTVAPPLPSPPLPTGTTGSSLTYTTQGPRTYLPSSMSRSSSDQGSTHSPQNIVPPSPIYQRTPIDPSRVICLGPLPENVQLPSPQTSMPTLRSAGAGPSVSPIAASPESPKFPPPNSPALTVDTLGSNFTVDEDHRIQEEITRRATLQRHNSAPLTHEPRSPRSAERIDFGSELIHVPQLANKRYSWEEP